MAWFDQITSKYVKNVANNYATEVGLDVFKIFPSITTAQLTGYIGKYTKADWLYIGTVADYLRQGATESKGDDFTLGKQSYTVLEYAFHKDISEDDRNEYDNPFDPVADAARFVIHRMNRVMLSVFLSNYFATSIWGTDVQGGAGHDFTKWSDGGSSSDPVSDVLSWQETVAKTTGFTPNKLVMTADVYRHLKVNSKITDRMKTTDNKVVGKDLLARLFEVDELHVMKDVNSAGTDYMNTAKLLLCYTPDRPSRMEPSAGYTMTYRQNGTMVKTRRIPMPALNNALRIEGIVKIDPVVLGTDLGLFAYDVV